MSDHVAAYRWVTDAPITYVHPKDVALRVRRFQEIAAAYGGIGGDTDLARRMNAHRDGAGFIAGLMLEKDLPVFEYAVAGEPIALMQLDLSEGVVEIKNLATHPGTVMAGGVMVEFALNRIEFYGRQGAKLADGTIYLETYNEESTKAYRALGFEAKSKRAMVLLAHESPLWARTDSGWRLAAHATKRYLATG